MSTLSNLGGRDTPYTLTFSVKEDDEYLTSGYNTYGQYPVQVSVTVRGTATTSPWTIGTTGFNTLEEAVAYANNTEGTEFEIIGTPGTYDLNKKIAIKAGKIITIKSSSETEAVVIKPTNGTVFNIVKGSTLKLHNIIFTDFTVQLFSNSGNLTVDNCTIMNGNKTTAGVALTNMGNATINDTVICNNNVTTLIANMVSANLTINNSKLDCG